MKECKCSSKSYITSEKSNKKEKYQKILNKKIWNFKKHIPLYIIINKSIIKNR